MTKFEERYNNLNSKQKEAVDYINGPLLVVAGPGTGKTEILALRVANILKETDTAPKNILCLTFTNSAAYNMRERLTKLIGRDAYKVSIHTFHSFGVDVISTYPEYFYRGAAFNPVDDVTQIEILEEILADLPHNNDLGNLLPDGGYVYLSDIKSVIGNLKKAGITSDELRSILDYNKQALESLNPSINEIFSQRISSKVISIVESFIEDLKTSNIADSPSSNIRSFIETLRISLETVLEDVEISGKNTPLSNWKSDMTKKDDEGRRVLKDTSYIEKLYSLADIYDQYQNLMYERRYYDYDDMILDAINGIEKNNSLRYELQDRFEYILVDEFQDTNDAQMKLLNQITKYDEEDRKPNIMAVGDDDQAIYKFQGAELSNVLNFKDTYPDTKIITITSNYRSIQDILDVARYIITQGKDRLENKYSYIDKTIVSAVEKSTAGEICCTSFPSSLHEYYWVASRIKELIQDGKPPSDIAVIARFHRQLVEMALLLNRLKVPITYERNNNVLEEPHVHQLIQICKFISSLCRKASDEADELLPEILSYPFWGLKRNLIWEIAKFAERSGDRRLKWLDVMQSHEDEHIQKIADFLINLATLSSHETLERVLDEIMGVTNDLVPETEQDEEENSTKSESQKFVSPFKQFYFGKKQLEENSVNYLKFLSSLRAFVQAIRDHKKDRVLNIEDLILFLELHEKNNIPVIDSSPFVNANNAVNLLTAHKAKGQEFDTVFVINCQEDVWTGGKKGSNLPMPINLPIAPAGDTTDDQLRLFYVAITRAKNNLYISSHEFKDNGKESSLLPFVIPPVEQDKSEIKLKEALTFEKHRFDENEIPETQDILTASWESYHKLPVIHDERAVFEKIIEHYQLSVTHLNNFLNVERGGPQLFFEQNLLRFPQSKNLAGSFGSAVHRTLQLIYGHLKKTGEVPLREVVLDWYDQELVFERLNKREFVHYSQKGRDALSIFYDNKIDTFHKSHLSEVNFRNQGVVIGNAHLTGKIDKMVPISDSEISVHDFKTGKAKTDWKGGSAYEKSLLYNYRRQLIFYKILVENSKDYGSKYQVHRGMLEFVEPKNDELIDLNLEIAVEDVTRTTELIKIVYQKIRDLDFPDTSSYKQNLKGIVDFEDDLLDGSI
jgi:DNA helicase-2/ATP-dependent DNA helicase PcrA